MYPGIRNKVIPTKLQSVFSDFPWIIWCIGSKSGTKVEMPVLRGETAHEYRGRVSNIFCNNSPNHCQKLFNHFFHLVASVTDEVVIVFIPVLHLVCLACTSKEVKSQGS